MGILFCLCVALAFGPALAAEPPPDAPAAKAADAPATAADAGSPAPAADDASVPAKATEPQPAAKPQQKPKPAVPLVPESLDDQARFLAGLPVSEGSPLQALEETRFWKAYAKSLGDDWARLREMRLDPMVTWAATALVPKTDMKAPVFYLFGGPDFLSVAALYPDAPVYLLGGLEPLGKVPRLSSLGQAALDEDMRNLRLSLNSIVRLSFFKTNDMRDDLIRTELRGVLPLLYVFVARADAKLLEQTRVEIDDAGELKELGEKELCKGVPGVRLRFQRAGHAGTQDLYYFKHDVSDAVIKGGPGFLAFFKRYAPANTFLKAASFLLHRSKQFSLTRDFLLANSRSILQDDSGLPFESLAKDKWNLTLFGTYLRPRPPFNSRLQPDLVEAFKAGPVEPLPFLTGYRRTGESNLVLAVPRTATPPAGEKEAAPAQK